MYCNTFEILHCLLQKFWNFAILIAILSKFCNNFEILQYLLQYFRDFEILFAILCKLSNTYCNAFIFCNTGCNTVIFYDIHYDTLILRSTYSIILLRSNKFSSNTYFNFIYYFISLIIIISTNVICDIYFIINYCTRSHILFCFILCCVVLSCVVLYCVV